MKKRYESDVMPDKCPKCGAPVYRILYGYPAMSEEEYYNTYHEHVIYGGCCISDDDPEWACSKCGTQIYRIPRIPKTKKEAFALLDEMLNDEEKQAIVNAESIELHFSLGLWIRNNWLYPQSQEEIEKLLNLFGKNHPVFVPHPDDESSIIVEAYQKYLKRKTQNKRN